MKQTTPELRLDIEAGLFREIQVDTLKMYKQLYLEPQTLLYKEPKLIHYIKRSPASYACKRGHALCMCRKFL
jgi:hypothetical protein